MVFQLKPTSLEYISKKTVHHLKKTHLMVAIGDNNIVYGILIGLDNGGTSSFRYFVLPVSEEHESLVTTTDSQNHRIKESDYNISIGTNEIRIDRNDRLPAGRDNINNVNPSLIVFSISLRNGICHCPKKLVSDNNTAHTQVAGVYGIQMIPAQVPSVDIESDLLGSG